MDKNINQGKFDQGQGNADKQKAGMDRKIQELMENNRTLKEELDIRNQEKKERELNDLRAKIAYEMKIPSDFWQFIKGENEEEIRKHAEEMNVITRKNWDFYYKQEQMRKNPPHAPGGAMVRMSDETDYNDYAKMSSYEQSVFRKKNPAKIREWLVENAKVAVK